MTLTADPPVTAEQVTRRYETALEAAFTTVSAARAAAREDLFGLTLSAIGRCARAAAYRLAHTEPSDPDLAATGEHRAANLGTWQHDGLLPLVADHLGGAAELPVTLRLGDLRVPGHLDLWDPEFGVASDLKTVREHFLARVLGAGVARLDHRFQVGGYALALHQAGKRVRWVAWIYLDRASGATHTVVEPWTTKFGLQILQRLWWLAGFAENPDMAPRQERGPGLSWVCDSCPWLRRCWGEQASPGRVGAQRVLAENETAVAHALASYQRACDAERRAREDKEFWRAVFEGSRPGVYGDWRWGFGRSREVTDVPKAEQALSAAGLPIPTAPRRGGLYVRPHARKEQPTRPAGRPPADSTTHPKDVTP